MDRRGSRLLVTCRSGDVGFEARPFPLGELNRVEGLMLLVGYLDRVGVDRRKREIRGWTGEALEPLVVRTGGHPLALELLAPHVAKLGPERVAAELSELLAKAEQESKEGRNRNLWASLEYSVRHLSAESRAALPAVALLSGGCLEGMAQAVVGLKQEAWAAVRRELEATGLVRVEGPFFRPHPVLAEADQVGAGTTTRDAEERFLAVVADFSVGFDKRIRTPNAGAAMAAMAATEAVARRAVEHAAASGRPELAWFVAVSLKLFLERSGRAGEGGRLITALRDGASTAAGELTQLTSHLICDTARALAEADPRAAIQELTELLAHLRQVEGWNTRGARAECLMTLGNVYYGFAGFPGDAIPPLKEAVRLFGELETEGRTDTANRAAALGDLANALSPLGRFDEALAVAEEALGLNRASGDLSAAARGEGQIAQILADQGRFAEAEKCFRCALEDAKSIGDDEGAGITWYSLGVLALKRDRPTEAGEPLRKALGAFQRAENERGRMRVLNALGNVEATLGRPTAALDWYEQSLSLAVGLEDLCGQAVAGGNRARALSARALEAGDPAECRRLLSEAIVGEREALAIYEQIGQPDLIATSHSNLASQLHLARQLDEAERHALQALETFERLQSPSTWKVLSILADIAEARTDTAAAAKWQRRAQEARAAAERAVADER